MVSTPLFNYTWPGTVQSCECNSTITPGPCVDKETCTDREALPPRTTHLLKDKLICGISVKEQEQVFYMHNFKGVRFPDEEKKCEKDYVPCPGPLLVENVLCVQDLAYCPINYLEIVQTEKV